MHWEPTKQPTGMPQRIIIYAAAGVFSAACLAGYAAHERHILHGLVEQNEQTSAVLSATRNQLNELNAKLQTQSAEKSQAAVKPDFGPLHARAGARHRVVPASDGRYAKLQSQVEAQGKALDETRNEIASTRTDLVSTRTELGGAIARTHDEVVLLQKKGERNYHEFDIVKSKQLNVAGPVGIKLKKANTKHEFADLDLLIDDRVLNQKHVNLYQPVMFYTPESSHPIELVINSITKNHIHGYVSAPRYRPSELTAMQNALATSSASGDVRAVSAPVPVRQKLPTPQ